MSNLDLRSVEGFDPAARADAATLERIQRQPRLFAEPAGGRFEPKGEIGLPVGAEVYIALIPALGDAERASLHQLVAVDVVRGLLGPAHAIPAECPDAAPGLARGRLAPQQLRHQRAVVD